MTDDEFDRMLIAAVFEAVARDGWRLASVASAAAQAGLDLARARSRLPTRHAVLERFGALADAAALDALADAGAGANVQEHLFDMLMRRIDMLQLHRAGMLAMLEALAGDPAAAIRLAASNLVSMGWLLDAAGVRASGLFGQIRAHGLLAVWLWTLRTWRIDDSEDLSATMAALDTALSRAAQIARSLPGYAADPAADAPENLVPTPGAQPVPPLAD